MFKYVWKTRGFRLENKQGAYINILVWDEVPTMVEIAIF